MKTFDEGKHEYKKDGIKYPSVTQILPPVDFHCTPEQLEAARLKGIEFHTKMEIFLDTGISGNDPDIEAVAEILTENKKNTGKLIDNENYLFSDKHLFAGRPDAIFEKAIVDFKRSVTDKKHMALQFAGYHILACENKLIEQTRKWYAIYGKDGKFKIVNVWNPDAESIFKALVKKHYIDRAVENYLK